MNYYLLFSLSVCFISWTSSAPTGLNSENKNETDHEKTEEDPFGEADDRINLNYGVAKAHAKDNKGGYSGVQTDSWGVTAGIKNIYTGQHVSLGSKAGSHSTTYSSGHGAPQTWATTDSAADHLSATGNAKAGFSGGEGTSHAESHSQTQTYDLGGGNVLYSNLKTKKKGDKGKTENTDMKIEENKAEEVKEDKDETEPETKIRKTTAFELDSELSFD